VSASEDRAIRAALIADPDLGAGNVLLKVIEHGAPLDGPGITFDVDVDGYPAWQPLTLGTLRDRVAARAACEDAAAAWQRAATKIDAAALPAQPSDLADLTIRLADLDTLLAAGRWTRLASELDEIDRDIAVATQLFHDTERTAATVLSTRDELRGLLRAYQAKAARLGAAEDPGLTERYDRARGLLWTAPCDLAAAADAVTGYQQAVLALGG